MSDIYVDDLLKEVFETERMLTACEAVEQELIEAGDLEPFVDGEGAL